jgi:hypothetical protein
MSPFAAAQGEKEMSELNRWYVSYTAPSDRGPRRYARMTRTFDTEEQARLFVREIGTNGLHLTAGTINPHLPKRVISACEMAAWVGEAMRN